MSSNARAVQQLKNVVRKQSKSFASMDFPHCKFVALSQKYTTTCWSTWPDVLSQLTIVCLWMYWWPYWEQFSVDVSWFFFFFGDLLWILWHQSHPEQFYPHTVCVSHHSCLQWVVLLSRSWEDQSWFFSKGDLFVSSETGLIFIEVNYFCPYEPTLHSFAELICTTAKYY